MDASPARKFSKVVEEKERTCSDAMASSPRYVGFLIRRPVLHAFVSIIHLAVLKAHLQVNSHCRLRLQNRPCLPLPAAGVGSIENTVLEHKHDGLVPPLPGFGPFLPEDNMREVELFDLELYAKVTELFMQYGPEDHSQALSALLLEQPISWTTCCSTLRAMQTNATDDDARVFGYDHLQHFVTFLAGFIDPRNWDFLQVQASTHHQPDIEELEKELANAEVLEQTPRPAKFGVHRLVLHAFSGRRRPGDFQEFLDAIVGDCSGIVVHVCVSRCHP